MITKGCVRSEEGKVWVWTSTPPSNIGLHFHSLNDLRKLRSFTCSGLPETKVTSLVLCLLLPCYTHELN